MRFNPPPNWPPPPPGWQPPQGWQPPVVWGPPPAGWPLWVEDRPRRPSVWASLGIAVASAFVVGALAGPLLLLPSGEASYAISYGFGRVLIPSLVIGVVWPFALPRAPLWYVPVAVLVVGGGLALALSGMMAADGSTNAQARATATSVVAPAS